MGEVGVVPVLSTHSSLGNFAKLVKIIFSFENFANLSKSLFIEEFRETVTGQNHFSFENFVKLSQVKIPFSPWGTCVQTYHFINRNTFSEVVTENAHRQRVHELSTKFTFSRKAFPESAIDMRSSGERFRKLLPQERHYAERVDGGRNFEESSRKYGLET